jgi:hypothetical protein
LRSDTTGKHSGRRAERQQTNEEEFLQHITPLELDDVASIHFRVSVVVGSVNCVEQLL